MLQLSQIWLCLKAVWRKIAASRADEEVELQMVNLPRWFTLGLEQRCSNPALEGRDQVWFSVLDQAGFSVLRGRKQPTWPSGFRTLSLENGSLFWEWSPQKQHFIQPKVLKVAGKAFGQHCRNNRILCSSAAGRDSRLRPLLCVFALLLAGLWEASRGAESCWNHVLSTRLQHGPLPRVSARSGLSSRHLPASEPLSAASNQRGHLLQHRLPCPWPTGTVLVSQGAVGVTCSLTFSE